MPFIAITIAADHCARFDPHSMNEQTRMELLVAHLFDSGRFKDATGDFKDIAEWRGVTMNIDDDAIKKIDWGIEPDWIHIGQGESKELWPGGSINLKFTPLSLTHLLLPSLDLNGTVDTSDLPRDLTELKIQFNQFAGPFDVEQLPQNLRFLDVSRNKFSGGFAIEAIPLGIVVIDASRNYFSGNLDFSELYKPQALQKIALNGNQFCGAVKIHRFPYSLEMLSLEGNSFIFAPLVLGDIPYGCTVRIGFKAFQPVQHVGDGNIDVQGRDDFIEIKRA